MFYSLIPCTFKVPSLFNHKPKMKKLLLSLALSFATTLSFAAVNYQGFIPNKTLNLNDPALTFDLDGDMNDDITFNLTGSSSNYNLTVSGPNLQFAQGNGSHSSYPEQLFIGKIVDGSKTWSGLGGTETIASSSGRDLAGATEFFIGLRLKSGNNYFYGWLLMELTSNHELRIKGVAFETIVNSYIVVGYTGSTFLSDNELASNGDDQWKLYPSIVKDQLQIENSENLVKARVYSLDGSLILEQTLSTKDAQLELGHLKPGFYLLEAQNDKGSAIKQKIVKS